MQSRHGASAEADKQTLIGACMGPKVVMPSAMEASLHYFLKKITVSVSRTNKGGTVRIPSELLELDFSVLARLYAVKVNGCSQRGALCACCIRFSRLSQVTDDHAYYVL